MNRFLKARIVEIYGTQFEFARKVRCHESEVSKVVRGHKDLDSKTKGKWARALKSDARELFGG